MTCREMDIETAKSLSQIDTINKNFDEIMFPNYYDYKYKDGYVKCENSLIKQLQELKSKRGCVSKDDKQLHKQLIKIENYVNNEKMK